MASIFKEDTYFTGPEFSKTGMYKMPTLFVKGYVVSDELDRVVRLTGLKHIHFGYQNSLNCNKVLLTKHMVSQCKYYLRRDFYVTLEINLNEIYTFDQRQETEKLYNNPRFLVLLCANFINVFDKIKSGGYINLNDLNDGTVTSYSFSVQDVITDSTKTPFEEYQQIIEYNP